MSPYIAIINSALAELQVVIDGKPEYALAVNKVKQNKVEFGSIFKSITLFGVPEYLKWIGQQIIFTTPSPIKQDVIRHSLADVINDISDTFYNNTALDEVELDIRLEEIIVGLYSYYVRHNVELPPIPDTGFATTGIYLVLEQDWVAVVIMMEILGETID